MKSLHIVYHKHSGDIIKVLEFPTLDSHLVDAPAYAEISENRDQISFVFPGSQEEQKQINIGSLIISFGLVSGRIYKIDGINGRIEGQMSNILIQAITNDTTGNIRRNENASFFVQLINTIIEH